jgi:hypothetical protein
MRFIIVTRVAATEEQPAAAREKERWAAKDLTSLVRRSTGGAAR